MIMDKSIWAALEVWEGTVTVGLLKKRIIARGDLEGMLDRWNGLSEEEKGRAEIRLENKWLGRSAIKNLIVG
jgi:hypothetical protein